MPDNGLLPNPSLVDSWPSLVAFMFQCFIVFGLPLLVGKTVKETKKNRAVVEDVRTTLTEKNGGGSVRDSLDQIQDILFAMQDRMADISTRVTELESNGLVTKSVNDVQEHESVYDRPSS